MFKHMDGFIFILWSCCSRIEGWTMVKHPPNTNVAGAVVILAAKKQKPLWKCNCRDTNTVCSYLGAFTTPFKTDHSDNSTPLASGLGWEKLFLQKTVPWPEESKWCCPAPNRPNTQKLLNLPLSALHVHSYKHNSEPLLLTFMLCAYVFVYSFLYGVKEKSLCGLDYF